MNNNTEKHFCIPGNDFPKIVIIGTGFAGLNFIKKLEKNLLKLF